MNAYKGSCLILGMLMLTSTALAGLWGSAFHRSQSKLENLALSISSLQHSLFVSRVQKNTVQSQLQKTELQIADSSKQLNSTLKNLAVQEKSLTLIQSQHLAALTQLQQQQQLLNEQLRAAYMLGRQQYLKILLNQENPATIDRYLVYYQYLTAARLQAIQQIQSTLQQIENISTAITQQTQKLEMVKAQEQTINQKLANEQHSRSQVLQQIEVNIGSKQQQLARLMQDKARLQNVITKVQRANIYYVPTTHFGVAGHELPWPINGGGRLIQGFGQPLAGGRLYTAGILMAAPMGTQIHAVYPGKVVFAHWLRGYGLLVIVQHNATYMSLYAHAESLYVKDGDNVVSGQVIATVGNSGGLADPALYFEITQNGTAVNPLKWLRKQG